MFYQIFFSPQVKQSVIISNKNCIYEFPDKLLNYLRLSRENYVSNILSMIADNFLDIQLILPLHSSEKVCALNYCLLLNNLVIIYILIYSNIVHDF